LLFLLDMEDNIDDNERGISKYFRYLSVFLSRNAAWWPKTIGIQMIWIFQEHR